jgi:hypothetical protein
MVQPGSKAGGTRGAGGAQVGPIFCRRGVAQATYLPVIGRVAEIRRPIRTGLGAPS